MSSVSLVILTQSFWKAKEGKGEEGEEREREHLPYSRYTWYWHTHQTAMNLGAKTHLRLGDAISADTTPYGKVWGHLRTHTVHPYTNSL